MPDTDVEKDAKTEEPTPRRIEEARERGQVAKSQELVSVLVTLAGLVFLWIYMPFLYKTVHEMVRWALETFNSPVPENPAEVTGVIIGAAGRALVMVAPLAGVVFVTAFFANVIQFGFVAAAESIAPDINRINPAQGLKRLFGVRTAVQFLFSMAKMTLAAVVIYFFVRWRGPRLTALVDGTVHNGVAAVLTEVLFLAATMLMLFLMLAVVDCVFQRHQYHVDLRMTREELKEELRRMEGDPAIRARRRAAMRRLLFSRMFAAVPESDVVVTNPTEFAVALRYRQDNDRAPVVTAKGRRKVAERMRELALENGVPIVERPVLARGLFFAVDVGGEVPPELYQAVAEVLAYVYTAHGNRKAA